MATEQEEEERLLAENTDKLALQLDELLKSKKKTNVSAKTHRGLATILAKMEHGDLDTAKSMRDSTWLKNQVDEQGKGEAASLLRFVFEQSAQDHKMATRTQYIQELLKAKPHLAPIAALNLAYSTPEPEAVDTLDQEKKQAASNDPPWRPLLPFVDLWKSPRCPLWEKRDRQLAAHRKYQRLRQKIANDSDAFLRGAQWAYIRLKYIIAGETVGLWGPYGVMCTQLERMIRLLEIGILSGDEPMCIRDVHERRHLERVAKQRRNPEKIRRYFTKGDERALNDSLNTAVERKQARRREQNSCQTPL